MKWDRDFDIKYKKIFDLKEVKRMKSDSCFLYGQPWFGCLQESSEKGLDIFAKFWKNKNIAYKEALRNYTGISHYVWNSFLFCICHVHNTVSIESC